MISASVTLNGNGRGRDRMQSLGRREPTGEVGRAFLTVSFRTKCPEVPIIRRRLARLGGLPPNHPDSNRSVQTHKNTNFSYKKDESMDRLARVGRTHAQRGIATSFILG